jgi:hypothetical protein
MARAALTGEDIRVLEFLAEHRVATTWHVQSLLECGRTGAERRLRHLAESGLVNLQRIFEGQPAACWITRRGLGGVGSDLPAPRLDLKGYRHDLGVAWLWLAARGGAFGQLSRVVSERAMRSADRRDPAPGRAYGIGAGPGARLHYPDLLLETAGGRLMALELELTSKGARRLDRIMLGYATDPRLDAILYLCPRGPLGRRVQDAARRSGLSDLVHVQQLAPSSPAGAPADGRASDRQAQRLRVRARSRAAEL